jgi:DNA-binding beta-propeller fold protein YncE
VTDDHAGNDGGVVVIDGNTNTEITRIGLLFPRSVTVNPVTNKIYVATMTIATEGALTVINGSDHEVLKAIDMPLYHWEAVSSVDETLNRIYVASGSIEGNLAVIDGSTDELITTTTLPYKPTGIAVNKENHYLYITGGDHYIMIVDGETGSVIETVTLNLGSNPSAIGINSVTNRVYTANSGTGRVSVLECNCLQE